jgi:hypothetical protein
MEKISEEYQEQEKFDLKEEVEKIQKQICCKWKEHNIIKEALMKFYRAGYKKGYDTGFEEAY